MTLPVLPSLQHPRRGAASGAQDAARMKLKLLQCCSSGLSGSMAAGGSRAQAGCRAAPSGGTGSPPPQFAPSQDPWQQEQPESSQGTARARTEPKPGCITSQQEQARRCSWRRWGELGVNNLLPREAAPSSFQTPSHHPRGSSARRKRNRAGKCLTAGSECLGKAGRELQPARQSRLQNHSGCCCIPQRCPAPASIHGEQRCCCCR